MMRFNPDRDRYDSVGQDTWVHPDEERFWLEQRGGHDEVAPPLLRCSLCHKPLAAMADCASCGDPEEMAA